MEEFHSSGLKVDDSGLDDFSDLIAQYSEKLSQDKVLDILESGAEELAADGRKLPSPLSKIRAPGYTHLVKTISTKVNRSRREIEVGWGKYYGPIVENGAPGRQKYRRNAHLITLYTRNQKKYYELMKKKFES